MTLRTRLALVLVALVLVPLVAAAILVLYAVPRAAADRADSLVMGASSAVTNQISQNCEQVATAAVVTGRMLGTSSPAAATRRVVSDGLVDWASVVNNSGGVVASSGQVPTQLRDRPVERLHPRRSGRCGARLRARGGCRRPPRARGGPCG